MYGHNSSHNCTTYGHNTSHNCTMYDHNSSHNCTMYDHNSSHNCTKYDHNSSHNSTMYDHNSPHNCTTYDHNSFYNTIPYVKTCQDCNSTTTATCVNHTSYMSCSCNSGYVGDGLNCTLMLYCSGSNCCPSGFNWTAQTKTCVDINECASPTLNKCSPTDTCVNKNGNYLCITNRTAPCGGSGATPCSSDQDCLRISGAPQCADPCSNYQVLNGTNRLATINSTGRFATDENLFGWFRYAGTGLSLKEGCVGPLKCGSLEPNTLGGIHPKIGDGIKMVPLQTNSVASGCSTGAKISVKACPGGYYVYKFSGSLRSDVYCTGDTTTPTTTSTTTTTTTPTTTSTTTPTTTRTTTSTTTPTTTSTTTPTTTRTTTSTTTPTTTSTTTPTTTRTTTQTTSTTTQTTTSSTAGIISSSSTMTLPQLVSILQDFFTKLQLLISGTLQKIQ
ncbi:uromodulin-like [Hyperolius riggenbachi]|uniref:uromodulin-like n=1 Tax=Hyperolius riggenbachi TaxID=752182 RepID=UPI0035A3161F